jgi:hypothetical protein
MYEANDLWMQHGIDPRVNTCRRMFWLRRVRMFLDYKIAHSKDSEEKKKLLASFNNHEEACNMLCGKGQVRTQDLGYQSGAL